MGKVGEFLKSKREEKGFSIDKIAEMTKINPRYLKALEDGNYHVIGGDVYCKGFLRNYARALEVDPQKVVEMYKEEKSLEGVEAAGEEPEKINKLAKYEDKKVEKVARKPVRWIVYLIVLILIGTSGGILLWQVSHKRAANIGKKPVIQKPITKEPAKKETEPTPVKNNKKETTKLTVAKKEEEPKSTNATEKTVNEEELKPTKTKETSVKTAEEEKNPPATENEKKEKPTGITLKGNVVAKTWVMVEVDGEKVFEGILDPPKTVQWHAEKDIKIRVGNAGGIEWYLNNKKIGFFGKSGEVITKSFTSEGE